MRFVRTSIIAAVVSAALAGAAFARDHESRMMLVAQPDGTVEHIPVSEVRLVTVPVDPVDMFEAAFGADSAFAEMERMAAAMETRTAAMVRAGSGKEGGDLVMTNAQGQPVGMKHYSFVSSSTDASGCTRTISYSSDGARAADHPRVIRTSAGNCDAQADPSPAIAPPARLPERVTPATGRPAAKPAPRIHPVSAPKPEDIFTPSRT